MRHVTRMIIASIYRKEKLVYCQSNEKILSSYCCSNVTEKLMLKIINFTNCCAVLFVSATQLDNHCHDLSSASTRFDLNLTNRTRPRLKIPQSFSPFVEKKTFYFGVSDIFCNSTVAVDNLY